MSNILDPKSLAPYTARTSAQDLANTMSIIGAIREGNRNLAEIYAGDIPRDLERLATALGYRIEKIDAPVASEVAA